MQHSLDIYRNRTPPKYDTGNQVPVYGGTERQTHLSVFFVCTLLSLHALQLVDWVYLVWIAYYVSVSRLAPELLWRPSGIFLARWQCESSATVEIAALEKMEDAILFQNENKD